MQLMKLQEPIIVAFLGAWDTSRSFQNLPRCASVFDLLGTSGSLQNLLACWALSTARTGGDLGGLGMVRVLAVFVVRLRAKTLEIF